MPFDLDDQLAAMTRTVRSGSRDGRPTKAVIASRTYHTSPEDLWDAITRPERLERWFLPVSGDLRRGGHYQLQDNAGGVIEACEAPHQLAATWEYGGQLSWLRVDIAPSDHGARLELQHVAPVDRGSPGAEHWATFGPGAAGVGWELAFQGLARHLEDPDAPGPDPEAVAAWAASSEARALYSAASQAWAEAAIADGAPEEDALAAAERTRAFYTGDTQAGG